MTFSYTLNIEKLRYTSRQSIWIHFFIEANFNLSSSDSFRRFASRMDNFEGENRRDDGRQGVGRGHRVWDGLPQNSAILRRPHCASSVRQPSAGQCLRQVNDMLPNINLYIINLYYQLGNNYSHRIHLILVAASS